MLHKVMDSPRPAAQMPLQARAHHTPTKPRPIAHGDVCILHTDERLVRFKIHASTSVEDYFTLWIEISEKLREKMGTLSQEQRNEVKREALESIREYPTESGISFPAEFLIVSGSKGRLSQ
jgi:hypothetical protein